MEGGGRGAGGASPVSQCAEVGDWPYSQKSFQLLPCLQKKKNFVLASISFSLDHAVARAHLKYVGFFPQSLYSLSLLNWVFQFIQEKFYLGSAYLGGFSTGMVVTVYIS